VADGHLFAQARVAMADALDATFRAAESAQRRGLRAGPEANVAVL
jgi:hypothetical protein